jgi:hypothetical protein
MASNLLSVASKLPIITIHAHIIKYPGGSPLEGSS